MKLLRRSIEPTKILRTKLAAILKNRNSSIHTIDMNGGRFLSHKAKKSTLGRIYKVNVS